MEGRAGDNPEGQGATGSGGDAGAIVPAKGRQRRVKLERRTPETDRIARRQGLALPTKLPFKGTLGYAVRNIPGGKFTFMEYARMSGDDKIQLIVAKWDSLTTRDRTRTSLDQLCDSFDILPGDVLKEVVGIAFDYNTDIANLVASVSQPKVVQASVREALKADGVEDRRMQLTHSGFLPQPKGSKTEINLNASASAAAAAKTTVQNEESGLPDFEESVIETVKAVRGDVDAGTASEEES